MVNALARQPHGSVLAWWHDFAASTSSATATSLPGTETPKEHIRAIGTPEIRLSETRVEHGVVRPYGTRRKKRHVEGRCLPRVEIPRWCAGLLSDVPAGRELHPKLTPKGY